MTSHFHINHVSMTSYHHIGTVFILVKRGNKIRRGVLSRDIVHVFEPDNVQVYTRYVYIYLNSYNMILFQGCYDKALVYLDQHFVIITIVTGSVPILLVRTYIYALK